MSASFEPKIIDLKGKQYPTYGWVLSEAHKKGLVSVTTKILQYPTTENGGFAIIEATVTGKDGELYTDIGDASPKNVNTMIAPHLLRMASTRAKGRALRDYINCGTALAEELND